MNSTDLLEAFRTQTRDTVPTYLWSDAEIYGYMDDAQRMFCRLTGGIADATSSLTKLRARTGSGFVTYDPKVLKIRAIFRADGENVAIRNFEDFELDSPTTLYSTEQGPIRYAVSGMADRRLKLVPLPAEDEELRMVIYRLPVETIAGSGQDLEIAEQHHLTLLKWMRHLAHLKTDAETFDRGKANQFQQEFVSYCEQAGDEKKRLEHKYRAVQFSW